ncbi:glycoside hydrolase family 68 protein [Clostridium sp. DJ247]|uniref:glycoside hydrolase family 68 protein n=1 Tax=Clostridium sp. DJ247 TaxID=2726188 RepID=UPI001628DA7B|nr:glycoside hydrolase family 68 protein [Clostridium sp. DJ247]MBC2579433.1 glycoside hydrolase family 68 protein [Clostridium sp. DJ247]
MIKSKVGKFVLIGSIISSCLVGTAQKSFAASSSMDYKETYGISHITRNDMLKIPEQQKSEQFKVPQFDASTIKNIPSAIKYDESGNKIDLDVWDTWPLQNADGTVANYNGYHIVFGLAGNPKEGSDTFIYLFYQKIGDTSIDSWKNAGRVFKNSDKFVPNDSILNNQAEEWSGSATLTSDGKVRLFYTNRHPWAPERGFYGKQTLTTAQINVSQPKADTLKADGVEDFKSIFDGDGKFYQTVDQAFAGGDYSDNHTLRDPHYVEDNGRKYLVFEANTGTETGYQGEESFFNKAYYGGSEKFFQAEKNKLLQSPNKPYAKIANGALGIIELNDDYTLKKVMKPLIASNTVTDEIERANVFNMNGKWYLFTSSRGSKMFVDGIDAEDIYMLGYVSDSLTGPYKPLNGTGLVLHQDLDPKDITWNYAHFAIPQVKGNNVVITSYMTNRGYFADHHSTFAPSFLLNIQGPKTSVVPNSILEQGQVTIDK